MKCGNFASGRNTNKKKCRWNEAETYTCEIQTGTAVYFSGAWRRESRGIVDGIPDAAVVRTFMMGIFFTTSPTIGGKVMRVVFSFCQKFLNMSCKAQQHCHTKPCLRWSSSHYKKPCRDWVSFEGETPQNVPVSTAVRCVGNQEEHKKSRTAVRGCSQNASFIIFRASRENKYNSPV